MAVSDIPNNIKTKIETASTKIKTLINDAIDTHYKIDSSSSKKGHAKAGGAPKDISLTLNNAQTKTVSNAGTDDGTYARTEHEHAIAIASINGYGITKLSDAVDSESKTLAATPYAVKQAYDIAVAANGNAGTGRSDENFTKDYKDKLDALEIITVDDFLNTTSENPVQNKVITSALAGKVDAQTEMGLSEKNYTAADQTAVRTIPNYLLKSKVINDFNTTTFNSSDPTALSAYQGRVLNEGKFNKSGGTITGDVSLTGTESNSQGKITAKKFVVQGKDNNDGSNYFLKANGSLDNNTYLKANGTSSQFIKGDGSFDDSTYIKTGGTKLTANGSTLNHDDSAVGSANTTKALRKFSYDAQGHITGVGNDITLATVATSGDYKDLSNKPTYTPTVTSTTDNKYPIGTLKLNGADQNSSDILYGINTDTTYEAGTGLSLSTNNNEFSVNFGTEENTVAQGNHTHPGLTQWEKYKDGHVTLFYNKDLELVYLRVYQSWGGFKYMNGSGYIANTWINFVTPTDTNYAMLKNYHPKGAIGLPVIVMGSGYSLRLEAYMKNTGEILMKSSENTSNQDVTFLLHGMYPTTANISDSD